MTGVLGCLLWQVPAFCEVTKPPTVASGANVDESRVQQTLYVDAANGEAADDDKHGGAEAPFATLAFACRMAEAAKDANRGVRVLIAAGTYREPIEIHPPANGKPDTDAPLVIEAAEHDQTVIDGADIEGWTPSTWTVEEGRWTHPWPFRRAAARVARSGGDSPPPGAAASYRHGDLVCVDGVVLRQGGALADLAPGSFWGRAPAPVAAGRRVKSAAPVVDQASGAAVFVQPPAETELANCIIQVGVRPHGLMIAGRRNVVVRGLLFEHAAAPSARANQEDAAAGLRFDSCSNVLVEDVLSQWNDGAGLEIAGPAGGAAGSANWTLRRVRLLHNGGVGLAVDGVRNLLAEDGEASFNNFRGDWAGWIDPQRVAGIKVSRVDGSMWRRQRAVSNACRGMWFAVCTNLTVEEAVVRDCLVSGLLIDESRGPTLVRRGLVVGTRAHPSVRAEAANPAAVSFFGSSNVTLESNVVANNAVPALGLSAAAPGTIHFVSGVPPGHSGQFTYRHNVFYGQDAGQMLVDWPTADRVGALDFLAFFRALNLEENCFWNPASAEVFGGYDKAGHHGPGVAFDAWAASLAARAGGEGKVPAGGARWQDPGFVDPAEGDFRLREDSALKEWDLPGEENTAGQ